MANSGVVLVTGASSGVGRATAALLSHNGFTVFGSSREPSRAEPLPGVELLSLDVRSDQSVAECVSRVLDTAGRIDVLFNNAGYELSGALEEISIDEAKAQFETNFFGVHRMVRAVLPSMREARSGRIINMSSLAGLVTVPFMGMYSATKFALESYSEALRLELRPFGIAVSQIEVGFLNTPMQLHRQRPENCIVDYDSRREKAFEVFVESEDIGPAADRVAEKVLQVVQSKRPRLRNLVGLEAHSVAGLRRLLPEGLYEMGVRRTFRLAD